MMHYELAYTKNFYEENYNYLLDLTKNISSIYSNNKVCIMCFNKDYKEAYFEFYCRCKIIKKNASKNILNLMKMVKTKYIMIILLSVLVERTLTKKG